MSMNTDGQAPMPSPEGGSPLFASTPAWERTRKRRSVAGGRKTGGSNAAPLVAVAAVVLGLGFAGAAAWYATQESRSVPELASGGVEPAPTPPDLTAQIAPPMEPAVEPIEQAALDTTPQPAPSPAKAAPKRQAPARAAGADETGVNASSSEAELPSGPTPYSELNPQVSTPSVTQAPAAIPETPPTLPSDRPAVTPLPQPDDGSPPTI
ncbi:MAG: hypothetical protein GC203_10810 [Phenylobacterium sp.]|uniref:hypothetical protein n=1 Tax=Phenylobacterium sp. TaxID=1871053 RepID=UPI0025ED525F|nr:hypothetical protein [Phenylobacterium sp.]MBI1198342.1 hypothetical protein [Phenylobacterium sp.]